MFFLINFSVLKYLFSTPLEQLQRIVCGNLFCCRESIVTPLRGESGFLFAALIRWLIFVFFVSLFVACGMTRPQEDSGPRTHFIHVVSNGWHTAIVMPATAFAATNILPEVADFPGAKFLEFGWGDRTYYPAKKKTIIMTLSAAMLSTSAIIHMAMLQAPPEDDVTGLEVISVKLTRAGLKRLTQAIAAEFERPAEGRAKPVSRGLYPNSHFYHAHGEFFLFNTCNTWTARMLYAGGIAISPPGVVTADGLMSSLRTALIVE